MKPVDQLSEEELEAEYLNLASMQAANQPLTDREEERLLELDAEMTARGM
jgi:hypothetical protein